MPVSKKSWKDALLSSGVPLEYSVAQILNAFEVGPQREYQYIRPNENGIPTQFSIDQHAYLLPTMDHHLELFVECKYRRQGTQWIFAPQPFGFDDESSFEQVFVNLDALSDVGRIDDSAIGRFSDMYQCATKGIEIHDSQAKPQSIERAITQLKYAVSAEIRECLWHQCDHLLGSRSPIFTLLPVLVTTAEMWIMNEATTIDNIRAADYLSEIADQTDLIFLFCPPDNLLQSYTRKSLTSFFTNEQIACIDKLLQEHHLHGFPFYVDYLSRLYPSLFVIVHLCRMNEVIQRLMAFFKKDETIDRNWPNQEIQPTK